MSKKENKEKAKQARAQARAKADAKKKVGIICIIAGIVLLVAFLVWVTIKDINDSKASSSEETTTEETTDETTTDTTETADETSDETAADEEEASTLNTEAGQIVEEGDTVNIDYTGYLDGEAFDGGSTNGAGTDLTIGSGQYIDGFEDGLIGKAVGDTVDLNLTFPEDYYSSDLAGQEVVFTVTINGIYE